MNDDVLFAVSITSLIFCVSTFVILVVLLVNLNKQRTFFQKLIASVSAYMN